MADIVLSTLNAKYIHAAFGLRYLLANLGPLRPQACIAEFDINQRPIDIVEGLLRHDPKIIGIGVYIWNVALVTEVVATLKRLRPRIHVVLGGPEVSYETADQPVAQSADFVITGEGDLTFRQVCEKLLSGSPPTQKILAAELPAFEALVLPYELYSDDDIAHRVLYVEASRGCPFTCEFCLSSLDIPVRAAPLGAFLGQLQRLLDRGARHFKFVDRTFNLNVSTSKAILEFLLERHRPGFFFHFEMVPDRLPEVLREVIARFPAGALQFEVGIQTFNEAVAARIQRRQNYGRLEENLRWLRSNTGVHIHADLIFGLPGESLECFGAGFDRLVSMGPHEIQVGLLKRLRGTPILHHDAEWEVVWNPNPPYELLQNKLIDFTTLQNMRRFARYWELVGNSGNFVHTVPMIWQTDKSPFRAFLRWSEWVHACTQRTDSIALVRLMKLLFDYLTKEARLDPSAVADSMLHDYQGGGRPDVPLFLREFVSSSSRGAAVRADAGSLPKRQARHLAT